MTAKKDPKDLLPLGRPSSYQPEYCQRLVNHMKEGGSLESFGSKIPCSIPTLYKWMQDFPEFLAARKEGLAFLHAFYESMGKMIATGQLRRVKWEKPMTDAGGKPMLHPQTGEVLMEREYEAVAGNSTAWIFLCKNMIGYRNENHISHSIEPPKSKAEALTPEERMKEIQEMTAALQEIHGDKPVIDVTPKRA